MSKINKYLEIDLYNILLNTKLNIATTLIHKTDHYIIGGGRYKPMTRIITNWITIEEYFKLLGSKIECLEK